MKTNFAQRLTKIFEEREITQQEAADKVGVRRQAVARWLNGTSEPEREKVIALSEFLNLPPAYIMFGEEGAFDSVEIDDDTIAIPVLSVEGGCWPSGRENSVVNMARTRKFDSYQNNKTFSTPSYATLCCFYCFIDVLFH